MHSHMTQNEQEQHTQTYSLSLSPSFTYQEAVLCLDVPVHYLLLMKIVDRIGKLVDEVRGFCFHHLRVVGHGSTQVPPCAELLVEGVCGERERERGEMIGGCIASIFESNMLEQAS